MPQPRQNRQRKPRTPEQKILQTMRKQMAKHVVEIALQVMPEQSARLQRIQEQLRIIRNTVLGELKKRYDQMVRTKTYRRILRQYRQIYEKSANTTDEKYIARLTAEMKRLNNQLNALGLGITGGRCSNPF